MNNVNKKISIIKLSFYQKNTKENKQKRLKKTAFVISLNFIARITKNRINHCSLFVLPRHFSPFDYHFVEPLGIAEQS